MSNLFLSLYNSLHSYSIRVTTNPLKLHRIASVHLLRGIVTHITLASPNLCEALQLAVSPIDTDCDGHCLKRTNNGCDKMRW